MQGRSKQFLSGFLVSCILVLGICGFIAVDLSTDRYLPGKIGPMLAISQIGPEGIDFAYLGEYYVLEPVPAAEVLSYTHEFRGLMPTGIRFATGLGSAAFHLLQDVWEEYS